MGAGDTVGEKLGFVSGMGVSSTLNIFFIVLHSVKQLVAYQDLT